jgi:uncharacterized protein (TIGR02596 family)
MSTKNFSGHVMGKSTVMHALGAGREISPCRSLESGKAQNSSDQCPLVSFSGAKPVSAFSLVEMLVVIAIMIVLMAVMIPASSSLMGGMNIGRSAGMVTDELNFARQTALSRNRDVEVRFYRMGSKMDGNDRQYRAFRSFLIDGIDPAGWKPLSRIKQLPEPIIISDNTTFSSLLDTGGGHSGLVSSNETLPGVGNTDYVSFLFRANGGTSLKPVTEKWFLTLFSQKAKAESGLPANYFTAQVDPVTGRTRSYRP